MAINFFKNKFFPTNPQTINPNKQSLFFQNTGDTAKNVNPGQGMGQGSGQNMSPQNILNYPGQGTNPLLGKMIGPGAGNQTQAQVIANQQAWQNRPVSGQPMPVVPGGNMQNPQTPNRPTGANIFGNNPITGNTPPAAEAGYGGYLQAWLKNKQAGMQSKQIIQPPSVATDRRANPILSTWTPEQGEYASGRTGGLIKPPSQAGPTVPTTGRGTGVQLPTWTDELKERAQGRIDKYLQPSPGIIPEAEAGRRQPPSIIQPPEGFKPPEGLPSPTLGTQEPETNLGRIPPSGLNPEQAERVKADFGNVIKDYQNMIISGQATPEIDQQVDQIIASNPTVTQENADDTLMAVAMKNYKKQAEMIMREGAGMGASSPELQRRMQDAMDSSMEQYWTAKIAMEQLDKTKAADLNLLQTELNWKTGERINTQEWEKLMTGDMSSQEYQLALKNLDITSQEKISQARLDFDKWQEGIQTEGYAGIPYSQLNEQQKLKFYQDELDFKKWQEGIITEGYRAYMYKPYSQLNEDERTQLLRDELKFKEWQEGVQGTGYQGTPFSYMIQKEQMAFDKWKAGYKGDGSTPFDQLNEERKLALYEDESKLKKWVEGWTEANGYNGKPYSQLNEEEKIQLEKDKLAYTKEYNSMMVNFENSWNTIKQQALTDAQVGRVRQLLGVKMDVEGNLEPVWGDTYLDTVDRLKMEKDLEIGLEQAKGYAEGQARGKIGKSLGGALTGAGTGAAIGSVIPGVGTVVGAVAGGIIGFLGGLFS